MYKGVSTNVNVLRKGPEEIAYVVKNQFVILMDAMTKENVGLDRKKKNLYIYEINVQGCFELLYFEVENQVRFRIVKIIQHD